MHFKTRNITDIEGTFIVPAYQRGYRWTKSEVMRLLNDIDSRKDRNNTAYCLQPLVVIPRDDGKYELVDGQQRLTTLLLVFAALKKYFPTIDLKKIRIDYNTRKETSIFIDDLLKAADNSCGDMTAVEKGKSVTVDNWHIYNAYINIVSWLEKTNNSLKRAMDLYNDFAERVKILWYESDDKDGHALFERLNIGRIPLTNAELVKALFLNRESLKEDPELKQNEIATQLEAMEKELQEENFWAFLTNDDGSGYSTRMDLIYRLMVPKEDKMDDKYATFFYFSDLINKKGKMTMQLWKDIREFYLKIREWHDDVLLHNYAGYLIALGDRKITIKTLLDETREMPKSKRLDWLEQKIAGQLKLPENTPLSELAYDQDKKLIYAILLWFNVKTMSKSGEKFPFGRFKENGGWTLEHIHAQNSQGLSKKEQWREWLRLNLKSLQALPEKDEELEREATDLLQALSGKDEKREKFDDIFKRISDKFHEAFSENEPHSIANLALLQNDDNAALNNSIFETKRAKLIERDMQGHFIPVCTRNVFMKYYSPAGSNQPYFWGVEDRAAYLKAIESALPAE